MGLSESQKEEYIGARERRIIVGKLDLKMQWKSVVQYFFRRDNDEDQPWPLNSRGNIDLLLRKINGVHR